MLKRNEKGVFVRTRFSWTPDGWGNGYFDNRGRFRVYRPDCPRAYEDGYALRSHVVFWLHNGCPHKGELHHINGDVADDRIENLKEMTNAKHQKLHKERLVWIICDNCETEFSVPMWRILQRKTRFCSQKCYHKFPRSVSHKKNIGAGLKKAWNEGRR